MFKEIRNVLPRILITENYLNDKVREDAMSFIMGCVKISVSPLKSSLKIKAKILLYDVNHMRDALQGSFFLLMSNTRALSSLRQGLDFDGNPIYVAKNVKKFPSLGTLFM